MHNEDSENARVAKEVVSNASKTAAQVALDALKVAEQVANQAAKVADNVAQTAQKTADSVLVMSQDINYIKKDIQEIKDKLDNKYATKEEVSSQIVTHVHNSYVSREEFKPVQNLVYGATGLILLGVLGAVIGLVVIK